MAVGGEHGAATDSDVWSILFGSAADAARGARNERPPRRVCEHPTVEYATKIPMRMHSSLRR